MSELRVLDHDTLGNLFEMTGGDEGFLAELIDTFVGDTAGLLGTMRQGLAGGDAAEVRRAAHSLKSNSATFGAPRLAAMSRELEAAAREGDLTGAGDQIAELEAECGRVAEALRLERTAR